MITAWAAQTVLLTALRGQALEDRVAAPTRVTPDQSIDSLLTMKAMTMTKLGCVLTIDTPLPRPATTMLVWMSFPVNVLVPAQSPSTV